MDGGNKCEVCGDRGSAAHYGAVVCEGCKAFFKRAKASKTLRDSYRCYLGQNCSITPETRNNCKFCRLQACLKLGMGDIAFSRVNRKVNRRPRFSENARHSQPYAEASPEVDNHYGSRQDTSRGEYGLGELGPPPPLIAMAPAAVSAVADEGSSCSTFENRAPYCTVAPSYVRGTYWDPGRVDRTTHAYLRIHYDTISANDRVATLPPGGDTNLPSDHVSSVQSNQVTTSHSEHSSESLENSLDGTTTVTTDGYAQHNREHEYNHFPLDLSRNPSSGNENAEMGVLTETLGDPIHENTAVDLTLPSLPIPDDVTVPFPESESSGSLPTVVGCLSDLLSIMYNVGVGVDGCENSGGTSRACEPLFRADYGRMYRQVFYDVVLQVERLHLNTPSAQSPNQNPGESFWPHLVKDMMKFAEKASDYIKLLPGFHSLPRSEIIQLTSNSLIAINFLTTLSRLYYNGEIYMYFDGFHFTMNHVREMFKETGDELEDLCRQFQRVKLSDEELSLVTAVYVTAPVNRGQESSEQLEYIHRTYRDLLRERLQHRPLDERQNLYRMIVRLLVMVTNQLNMMLAQPVTGAQPSLPFT